MISRMGEKQRRHMRVYQQISWIGLVVDDSEDFIAHKIFEESGSMDHSNVPGRKLIWGTRNDIFIGTSFSPKFGVEIDLQARIW